MLPDGMTCHSSEKLYDKIYSFSTQTKNIDLPQVFAANNRCWKTPQNNPAYNKQELQEQHSVAVKVLLSKQEVHIWYQSCLPFVLTKFLAGAKCPHRQTVQPFTGY